MKKILLHFSLVLLPLLLSPVLAISQITVTTGAAVTAATLVNNLTGTGVVVLNPTLTCANNAKGTFTGTSILSFNAGVVMTSGLANNAGRPANIFASTANGTPGDPQLTTLSGNPTFDACVLQFDFRPTGDTIKFDYAFGSEEYPGYSCSNYNDVFGFFISGPGIAGATNIALVPGIGVPVAVSVNSINCNNGAQCRATGPGAPYCTYFVNNATGANIVYDGMTKTLTAISKVTPCDTYHLKIGIADANDDILDSGVFLKAGSLRSKTFSAGAHGVNPLDTLYGSQYIVRGCTPGYFVFTNTGSLTDSIIVKFQISGTGINGVDYATIADSTIIHVGQATDTVFIYGLTSTTGIRTVKLYIFAPYSCTTTGPTIMDSVQLTIFDSFFVNITTPDTAVCIGQQVQINTAGAANLNYSWSPAGTLNNSTIQNPISTPPLGTTTYTVTAGLPGCPQSRDVIRVTAVAPPPPPIVTNRNYCTGDTPAPFVVSGAGTVYWYPTSALTGGSPIPPPINTTVAGTYTFYFNQAIGSCQSPVDSITIIVYPGVIADFSSSLDRGCYGDVVTIQDNSSPNTVTYTWNFGDGSPTVTGTTATPTHTYGRANGVGGDYLITLEARSVDNCRSRDSMIVDTRHGVEASFSTNDDIICAVNPAETITLTNLSSAFVHNLPPVITTPTPVDVSLLTYEWNFGDGTPSEPGIMPTSVPHSYPVAGYYTITLVVTDTIGCKDTFSVPIISQRVDITGWDDSTLCLRQPMLIRSTIASYPIESDPTEYTYLWTESSPNLDDPNVQEPYLSGFGDFVNVLEATHNGSSWGCIATHTITVHSVLGQLLTNVTPDATIPYGSTIQLNSSNEMYYHWTPNDGSIDNPNINNPVAAPQQTTIYTVYGMDKYGCVDSASFTITVDSNLTEGIPSAFTPNGDGLNDVFRPIGVKTHERLVEFRVYNRYGIEVFYTRDAGKGWDGTFNGVPQDLGVYHYQFIAAHPDGTNRKYKGDVTLIR